MALNARLRLGAALGGTTSVIRLELSDGISELFELTVRFRSENPAVPLDQVAGDTAEVLLDDEAFVRRIPGIVRQVRQLTAEPTGVSEYELVLVPELWLTTRRRDHRIFQDQTAVQIVESILGGYDGRIPAPRLRLAEPHPAREYTVQYAETDFDFIARILADEGICWCFDLAGNAGWTLVDNTTLLAPPELPPVVTFAEASELAPDRAAAPHVEALELRVRVETSAVALRSYNEENPGLELDARVDAAEADQVTREARLEAYEYDGLSFRSATDGAALAARRLEEARAMQRTVVCRSSFLASAGTRLNLIGHPREDVDGVLLVQQARLVASSSERESFLRHELVCTRATVAHRPARLPKPRVAGTHVAFVVGAPGDEIDVDALGRIEVELRWDRRDLHAGGVSRRVRVSQAWAGSGFGFTLLPRVGDEVMIGYVDGDLDEPIVVGRVHNGRSPHPLALPRDKTQSVWRSRSTPGGEGFNHILMEDAAGRERLELHAHRDFRSDTGRSSDTSVGVNHTITVGGSSTTKVAGGQSTSAGSVSTSTGPYRVSARTVTINASETMGLVAGDVRRDSSTNHFIDTGGLWVKAKSIVQLIAGKILAQGDSEVRLVSGGSSITLTPGGIQIKSGGEVVVNGSVIKLN
ncbi:MAG: type VI secretion system tip protein TssI/VgrG [Polyangiaceae bacterium]